MGALPVTLPPEHENALKLVLSSVDEAKDVHEAARRKWERYYRLYRSYKDFDSSLRDASPNDVDSILRDGQNTFDAHLFIPFTFSTIESQVPRLIVFNPRITVRPGDPDSEQNVDAVKLTLDRQMSKTKLPLTLQSLGKSGLTYGLGVIETAWEKTERRRRRLERGTSHEWIAGEPTSSVIYEGGKATCLDIFDWIWDPYAYDAETLRWAVKRLWRPSSYVKDMIERKIWTIPDEVSIEDVCQLGNETGRDEIWADRMKVGGYQRPNDRGHHLHEVLEFHDGAQVVTVLDRELVVQAGENPYWHGEIPFQIYRPTEVLHEMVGIGEPEAIEDLNIELNELRTSRRQNARLVLQRPFAYFDGLVDPNDLEFGPGIGIPVDGDPRELLFPIPLQDIPQSGYQEEASYKADIERTTGIDDSSAGVAGGGGGVADTATGAQLVQQAASIRIQNKTLRLNLEAVKPMISQWLALNQQKITSTMQMPGPPQPGDMEHRSWSWYTIGPEQLAGEFELEPDAESMSPDNAIQKANRATLLLNSFRGDPDIEQRKLKQQVLDDAGVPNAETFLVPQEPQVPAAALDLVRGELAEEHGVPPEVFGEMLVEAMNALEGAQAAADRGQLGDEAPEAPVPA